MAGTEAQICEVDDEFIVLPGTILPKKITYDANVQLKCADDNDGVRIPRQVTIGIRECNVKYISSHGACCCDEKTTREQADNDDLLLPW